MPLLRVKQQSLPLNGNGRPAKPWGMAHDGKRQQRALLASATQLMGAGGVNRPEAARLNKLRQPWQEDAWAYRDAIGELRYATTYLGNACRKIVLVPSAYVPGELDPYPLNEISDCPDNVKAAADDALKRLSSGGPLAMGALQRDIAENFEVAGECFLVGWPPNTQLPEQNNTDEIWEIRSVSEVSASSDGTLQLRIEGSQPTPIPDGVFLQRLWYPHPRRKSLADSPFAAMLDICEEMLILSRDIRASGRSRLANNGLLLLPDKLTVVRANMQDDANDNQQDEFMVELIQAGMAAIQDEGSASAIFPILVRGPKDELQAVRQVQIARDQSQKAADRTELIGRMATTLDLPAEVLTGKGDLNHWTAWSVSDDTFSDHIEPLVMVIDDAITAGYMRLALQQTPGLDQDWVSKVIIWHDPTRLVRHPDRSQDALQAYDRLALSDAALRDTMGFSDNDAPGADELLIRLLVRQNRLDPTITAQIIKRLDNSLDISAVKPEAKPTEPGQTDENPMGPADSGGPNNEAPNPTPNPMGPPQGGQPSESAPVVPGLAAALTAAAPHVAKGNKQLARIESELFDKLMTASNATMSRALEKAGARIRTTVGRTASGRAWCASHPNMKLCFLISNAMMADAGLTEQLLLNDAWGSLKNEYMQYVEYADQRTVETAEQMLKANPGKLGLLRQQLAHYAEFGWNHLESELQRTAMGYLSNASSELGMDEEGEIVTSRLVSPQIVKNAIARIGGALIHSSDAKQFDPTVSVDVPTTGLTTGPAVSQTLQDGGLGIESYTWVHGFTPTPFEPHLNLDGVEFSSWTDDVLSNEDEFPDRDYFIPGDHDGCSCDFHVNWSDNAVVAAGRPKVPGSWPNWQQFYEGQTRDEGGRFGEGKESGDSTGTPADRAAAIQNAKENAGMAKGTAAKLYDQGKLDDAVELAQTQQSDQAVSDARDTAQQQYDQYQASITPEDKAAAEERHAQSSRAGGDDRPGYPTRVRMCGQLMDKYGDGEHAPCIWCGRTLEQSTVSLDRLVPGSEGGKYVMANLAPSCYDCNNWRGDANFNDAMSAAKEWEQSLTAANDTPKFPLGTWVSAATVGYHPEPENSDPDMPLDIPLEFVSGKLDGYYVGTFDYFKYIVAGYDVDADTIKPAPDAENEEPDNAVAQSPEQQ